MALGWEEAREGGEEGGEGKKGRDDWVDKKGFDGREEDADEPELEGDKKFKFGLFCFDDEKGRGEGERKEGRIACQFPSRSRSPSPLSATEDFT